MKTDALLNTSSRKYINQRIEVCKSPVDGGERNLDLRRLPMRNIAKRGRLTLRRLWSTAVRFNFTRNKITGIDLRRLCRENATDEVTLVVHSEDVDYTPYFPNNFTVTKRSDVAADMHVDVHYRGLADIPSNSYGVILCTGLLEHVPDPQWLIDQLHRILWPGGRLIISASAVFSFHEAPDNFFHFTPFGFRVLFKQWSEFESLRGSSRPFRTIGILLQRINLQADIFPPVRLLVEVMFRIVPLLDLFVIQQYNTLQFRDDRAITDSFMPSNVHAVVIK